MAVKQISLGLRSNPARDGSVSVARLINCYVEAAGEEGAALLPIYACDGFEDFATLTGAATVRAMLSFDATKLYVVASDKVFKVTSGGIVTLIGTVSLVGIATIGRNRREPNAQVAIAAGGSFYIVEADVLTTIDLAPLQTGNLVSVLAHNGYFILLFDNSEWFVTSVDSGTQIDPLDFAKAISSPDGLVGGAVRGEDVVLFGDRSTEFNRDTGATDFPFERSAAMQVGCFAAGSIAEIIIPGEGGVTDSVIWAATDSNGAYAGVMLMEGYGAVKISTHDLDRKITEDVSPATIRAFTYSSRGHVFYVITGSTWTYEWDATTRLWHERKSFGLDRWRIGAAAPLGSVMVVGDLLAGKLYNMRPGVVSSNASSLTMRQSNDNGSTWSASRTVSMSGSDLKQRFKLLRLGQSKEDGKVFELVVTEAIREASEHVPMTVVPPHVHAWPNPVRVHGLYVDVIPGSSQTSRPKAITRCAVDVEGVKA